MSGSSTYKPVPLLLVCLCILLVAISCVNATASQCSKPMDSYMSASKARVVAATLASTFDFSKDLLASEGSPNSQQDAATLSEFSYESLSEAAKENVKQSPKYFTGKTGPLPYRIENRAMHFVGKKQQTCVACRLNCLDPIPEFGSIFSQCANQFYYYGCEKEAPCHTLSDGTVVLETAVGICLERNKCKLVSSLESLQKAKTIKIGLHTRKLSTPSVVEVKKRVVDRVGHYLEEFYGQGN